MAGHQERVLKAKDRKTRREPLVRLAAAKRVLLILILCLCAVEAALAFAAAQPAKVQQASAGVSEYWLDSMQGVSLLTVVSAKHPVEAAPEIELTEAGGVSLDPRAAAALTGLLAAAEKAGYELTLKSGFTGIREQDALHQKKAEELTRNKTYTLVRAEADSARIAPPGGSCEDLLGLSVEFAGNAGFRKTRESQWLDSNGVFYGFVRRYQKEKEGVTGMLESMTHYRYVGKEHAVRMRMLGMCLEEYTAYLQEAVR